MKTCQQCKCEAQDGARFCPNCGAKLPGAPVSGGVTPGAPVSSASVPPTNAAATPVPSAPAPATLAASAAATAAGNATIPLPPAQASIVSPTPVSSVAPLQTAPPPPPTPPANATKRINDLLHDRYLILQKLGEGGMGAVYLAEDSSLFGKKCIIKEMLPYYSNDQEKTEAEKFFLREVQLLAQLNHPGIPQIFDHFIISDHYYYVMEFVDGQTLAALAQAKNGRLPEAEMLEYARQIIDVLDCIASRPEPIIHRDIKPENIIVDAATGKAKLVDFGLAKAQSSKPVLSGEKSSALGTPGYAPPEQYQGKAEPRSDVYALGATMHHMLSGVDPRTASAPFQYDPLARLNPTLSNFTVQLVERMLSLNVAQRPSAGQLKQLFANIKTGIQQPVPGVPQAPGLPQSPTQLSGLAFNFRSGVSARNVTELAQHADRYWNDGVFHLYQGDFERWLRAQGQGQYADAAAHIRLNSTNDRSAGLEEFLRQLNPQLTAPVLQASTSMLDLGQVEKGGKRTVQIEITNATRGYLYGAVTALAPWLRVNTPRITVLGGQKQIVSVEINTAGLAMGNIQTTGLEIQTNGGGLLVTVQMQVSWPPRVKVTPAALNLGAVLNEQRGMPLAGQIVIFNDGGSPLQGDLRTNTPWLALAPGQPTQINLGSEQSITVQVIANTALMQANQINEGSLIITTPLETVSLPVKAGVRKASFTPARRAMVWTGFLALWLVSMTLITYPLAILTRWILYGLSDNALASALPLQIVSPVANALYSAGFPYGMVVPGVLAVASASMLLLGVVTGLLARMLIHPLDEIELYYSPRLQGALPAWGFDPKLARFARTGLFLLGLLAVVLTNIVSFEWYLRLPFGIALGAALAFGIVIPSTAGPQHAVKVLFRLLAALGLVGLRTVMYPTGGLIEPALWGVFGLLLAPNLNAPMPLRWRSIQAQYRPAMLALAFALLAGGLTRWIFYQSDYPIYRVFGGRLFAAPFIHAVAYAVWVAAGLAGSYAALRMLQPLGHTGQPPFSPRVYWIMTTVSALLLLVVNLIVRLPFQFTSYGNWVILILDLAAAGAIAVFALQRKQAAQHWLLKTVQTMGSTSGKLRQLPGQTASGGLTQKATSLPERTAQRLQSLLGPAPLDGLTPVTAASAVLVALAVLPFLTFTIWSFIALFLSLLGFIIVAAIGLGVVYMVWKANKK